MSFNTIPGGAGADSFIGTSGVDVLVAFNVNKRAYFEAKADNDLIRVEQPDIGVSSRFTVLGNNGFDTLEVTSALEFSTINGNGAADFITVSETAAQSLITGGKGRDTLRVNDLVNATYSGGEGDDLLGFDDQDDENLVIANSTVNGNQGNDEINLAEVDQITNSVIYGGDNNDTVRNYEGSGTNVTVNGNKGNDLIDFSDEDILGIAGLTLFGGDGDDTLDSFTSAYFSGDVGNDTIYGSGAADTILGVQGNDSLLGDGGNDSIGAGTGDDNIEGGFGSDTLLGGDGNDTFVVYGDPGLFGDADLIIGGGGGDTYTYGGDFGGEDAQGVPIEDGVERYIISAVSQSSASTTGGTWDIYNPFSFAGQPAGIDKLDITAVANTLAGGPLTGVPRFTIASTINLGIVDDLGEVKEDLDTGAFAASTPSGLIGYYLNFTIQPDPLVAGTAYTTLWIQNNQRSFTSDDLLFQFNGSGASASTWITANDILA